MPLIDPGALPTAGDTIDASTRPEAAASSAQVRDAPFDVFLSHSSRDKATVERIARALKEAGIEPWFDTWHLTPGGDWQSEIAAGIRASRSCAVCVGAEGLGDWERQELSLALDHAAKDRHFRVFAVLLPGVPEPFDPTQLPPFVSTRTWVDFRRGFNDRRVFQRLVNAVVGIPVGAEEAPAARPETCPYRGLETFDEEHTEFFFGRAADVQRLVERLKERRFLAVLGPSGSGKSSLVRAGLVPALRRGGLPGSDTWRVVVFRPGAEPLTTLAAHLLDIAPGGSMQATVDLLAEDPRTLHLAVARAFASAPEQERCLFVVDQFEEAFTLCHDDAHRRAFFANLLHAAFAPGGKAYIVLTMRADFYPKCSAVPELAQGISANQFLAWPMEEWALAEAIEEPARAVGLQLEEGLTDQILADLRQAPGALPLMEHTLLELWERRRGSMLTLEAYRETGGVAGSLAKRADLVYEGLPEPERTTTRRVLLRLTQPGEGTEDTRRRAAFEELVGTGEQREGVERVVTALTNARLLTTGSDPSCTGGFVEVSHEALIRGWPRLREWLDEDRAGLRTHRRLTEAAQEWARSERDPELLYRGARLAQATEWAERSRASLNALETEFLDRSLDAQESAARRRRRRARVLAASLTAGLVIVTGLATLAFLQKGRADDASRLALSREIAATSLEQLGRDSHLSLLLAIEAYDTAPTAQAEAALRRAVAGSHLRGIFSAGEAGRNAESIIDASRDGKLIAAGLGGGNAIVWDRASGKRVALLEDPAPAAKPAPPKGEEGGPGFVAFSPDGGRLLAGTGDGPALIWSIREGRVVTRLQRPNLFPIGWMPDGRRVVTAGGGGMRLWDAVTGAVLREYKGGDIKPGGPPVEAHMSRNGKLLAMSGERGVHVVETSSGRTVSTLAGGLQIPFHGSSFSPDGRLFVTMPFDGSSQTVWNVVTGEIVRVIRPSSETHSASFSYDGSRLITGSLDGASRIWDVRTGRLLVELTGHTSSIGTVAFSPDGKTALTSSEDSTARIWDVTTGKTLAVLAGHNRPVPFAFYTGDGRFVVTAGGFGSTDVRVWEVRGGATAVLRGHEGPVFSARFSPDGKALLSGGPDGSVRTWDVATGRQTWMFRPPPRPGFEFHLFGRFSPDGRTIVTGGARFGGFEFGPADPVRLIDRATGKVRLEIMPPQDDPLDLCPPGPPGSCPAGGVLSPDGRTLAMGGEDGVLRFWDASTAKRLKDIEIREGIAGMEWRPDGRVFVAMTWSGAVHLFDSATYKKLRVLREGERGEVNIPGLFPDFDASGRYLATGDTDSTARIWHAASGRLVAQLEHGAPLFDVAFSRDGRFLAAASGDAATIWDVDAQRQLAQLPGHRGPVITVDFSPDGSSIVTAGEDRTIRIWRCEVCAPIDQVLRLARSRVVRPLTPAERAKYLHEGD